MFSRVPLMFSLVPLMFALVPPRLFALSRETSIRRTKKINDEGPRGGGGRPDPRGAGDPTRAPTIFLYFCRCPRLCLALVAPASGYGDGSRTGGRMVAHNYRNFFFSIVMRNAIAWKGVLQPIQKPFESKLCFSQVKLRTMWNRGGPFYSSGAFKSRCAHRIFG